MNRLENTEDKDKKIEKIKIIRKNKRIVKRLEKKLEKKRNKENQLTVSYGIKILRVYFLRIEDK